MKKRTISLVVFILILATLFSQIDVGDILAILKKSSPWYLFLTFASFSLSYFFRSLRFKVLLEHLQLNIFKLYAITCCHGFLNHVMPARSGETSYPLFLKKVFGTSYSESVASLFVARVLDLIVLSCYFAFCLLINTQVNINYTYVFSMLALMLIFSTACLVLVIPITDFSLKTVKTIIKKLKPNSSKAIIEHLDSAGSKLKEYFSSQDIKRNILKAFLLSLLVWGSIFVFFYFGAVNFGIKLSISKIIIGSTACVFSIILPVNALGSIGTWEAGWAVGFTLLGLDRKLAISTGFGTHIFAISYSGVLALFGWLYLNYAHTEDCVIDSS